MLFSLENAFSESPILKLNLLKLVCIKYVGVYKSVYTLQKFIYIVHKLLQNKI